MEVYEGNSIPELEKPKCSVIQCELKTGIVVTLDEKRKSDEKPYILIFDSVEKASEFSEARILENPDIECSTYDYQGEYLDTKRAKQF